MITLLLEEKYHIHCIYQTHSQLADSLSVADGVLKVGVNEVSVVYFRSGYTPSDYPSPLQWEVREKIELTRAIKVLIFAMFSLVSQCVVASHGSQEGAAAALSSRDGGEAL